jgi:hypothetical protein
MSAVRSPPFDYAQLEISAQVIASEAAVNIRAHGQLVAQNIIAIGAELTKVKEAISHGNYLAWIDAEFGWSNRTARNYVRAYEAFKSEIVSDLEPIDIKSPSEKEPSTIKELKVPHMANDVEVSSAFPVTMVDFTTTQLLAQGLVSA